MATHISVDRQSISGSGPALTAIRPCAAAVCFRSKGNEVEFLLVKTKSARWTFPKGGVKQGETYSDAAAREAFEEAGVRGSVHLQSFARYKHIKISAGATREDLVHAHLCEVSSLLPPEEGYRDPTWFSPGTAKLMLSQGRSAMYSNQVVKIVELAALLIRSNPSAKTWHDNSTQRFHRPLTPL